MGVALWWAIGLVGLWFIHKTARRPRRLRYRPMPKYDVRDDALWIVLWLIVLAGMAIAWALGAFEWEPTMI